MGLIKILKEFEFDMNLDLKMKLKKKNSFSLSSFGPLGLVFFSFSYAAHLPRFPPFPWPSFASAASAQLRSPSPTLPRWAGLAASWAGQSRRHRCTSTNVSNRRGHVAAVAAQLYRTGVLK